MGLWTYSPHMGLWTYSPHVGLWTYSPHVGLWTYSPHVGLWTYGWPLHLTGMHAADCWLDSCPTLFELVIFFIDWNKL